MRLRHAKIICTLGPATSDVKAIADLIAAGMDVARLNFSHGSHEEHAGRLTAVREAARAQGKSIAVLQDLPGPKIRSGNGATGRDRRRRAGGSRGRQRWRADTIAVEYAGLAADLHPA